VDAAAHLAHVLDNLFLAFLMLGDLDGLARHGYLRSYDGGIKNSRLQIVDVVEE
jgi:hypothetical protein